MPSQTAHLGNLSMRNVQHPRSRTFRLDSTSLFSFAETEYTCCLPRFSDSSNPASRITRRCFEVLYCETLRHSEISFTLKACLNRSCRIRKRVSSPRAFKAAMQSDSITAPVISDSPLQSRRLQGGERIQRCFDSRRKRLHARAQRKIRRRFKRVTDRRFMMHEVKGLGPIRPFPQVGIRTNNPIF